MIGLRRSRRAVAAAALVGLLLSASGCTGDDRTSMPTTSPAPPSSVEPSGSGSTARPVDQPFGTACPDLPGTGPGSLVDLSSQDWITAMENIPALAQLSVTTAFAGLANDLSGLQQATIFAPVDSAFRELGVVRGRELLTDPGKAADVIRYHVVPGRLAPEALPGSHPTLTGQAIEITGGGEDYTVNSKATIICGNLQTQNATLYLIDQVLQPM